jgi:hypothetical protein
MAAFIRLQPKDAAKLLEAKYKEAGGSAQHAAALIGCSTQTFIRWATRLKIMDKLRAQRALIRKKAGK